VDLKRWLKDVLLCPETQKTWPLTHDVQDVVGDLRGGDGALFGVRLQDLEHGLQLVQGAVLTLLADELSTHRLGKKNTYNLSFVCFCVSFFSLYIY